MAPFESFFAGLGVEPSPVTRAVLAVSRNPFPLLLGSLLIIGLMAKELVLRNKWASACLNLCAFIIVDGLSRFSDYAMGVPLLDLIKRVG